MVESRVAEAFAPGHVTGIFRPAASGHDPRSIGSVGAGLVLSLGAHATVRWDPAGRRRLTVHGAAGRSWPITEEAVHRLVHGQPGSFDVALRHDLPIGQGFGMSAAGTLAATLAVARLVGLPRTRAIEVAHLAELFGGGGLGGVAAILGGGFEVRSRPGVPPWGRVRHLPAPSSIWVGVVGPPIPTSAALRDPAFRRRVTREARELDPLLKEPTLDRFLRASQRFGDSVHPGSAHLRRIVRGLRAHGAWATPAMFGESFFAVPRRISDRTRLAGWLARQGVGAVELRPARTGARVLRIRCAEAARRPRKDFRGGRARRRP